MSEIIQLDDGYPAVLWCYYEEKSFLNVSIIGIGSEQAEN